MSINKMGRKLKIYGQNVQGLRGNEEKNEYITKFMEKKFDAYILQETHFEGDYTKILDNGYVMVHHGPTKQLRSGAKGGVAIILSREFDEG